PHERRGHALGDRSRGTRQAEHFPGEHEARRRPGLEIGQRPTREARGGDRREAVQTSSRRRGSVMHRGPPPPRTSSLPSIVIATRSPCIAAKKFGTSFTPFDFLRRCKTASRSGPTKWGG